MWEICSWFREKPDVAVVEPAPAEPAEPATRIARSGTLKASILRVIENHHVLQAGAGARAPNDSPPSLRICESPQYVYDQDRLREL